jgi:cytochrome c oxidase cbb3-type subunit 3|tara:strand:- start:544 stop:954 length:411 start_codon:yes stop_codon:yes gene_type:complete
MVVVACGGSDSGASTSPSSDAGDRVFAGGVAPPTEILENPFDSDTDAVVVGEGLFAAMNCGECHGGGGVGFVGPSLVDGRWRYGGDDGELYQSIYAGRSRGMPAYGGILADAAIWSIVTYVRAQPIPESVPTESWR